MTTTIHTVTFPDGKTAGRTSKTKTYPFAVIGQPSKASALAAARSTTSDKNHFSFLSNCASVQPGATYPEPGFSFPVSAKHHAEGLIMLEQTPDVADYVAGRVAARVAAVEARAAEGFYDRWSALAWSSRRDLAEKAAAGWGSFENVRVAETSIKVKSPKLAAA